MQVMGREEGLREGKRKGGKGRSCNDGGTGSKRWEGKGKEVKKGKENILVVGRGGGNSRDKKGKREVKMGSWL